MTRMRTARSLPAALLLTAAPAAADVICDELWFARNMVFHAAGYCFGSALGQAVFGNAGCTGTDISLDPDAAEAVARFRAREAEYNCAVDSSRSTLDIPNLPLRKALTDQPIRTEYESACIGWLRPPMDVLSGWRGDAYTMGQIAVGDTLLFSHEDWRNWTFVQVLRNDDVQVLGWVRLGPHDPNMCDGWAG